MTDERKKDLGAISVTALTGQVRDAIEGRLRSVWVRGELSNFRGPAPSGHLYFSLKDSESVVAVAMFGATRMPSFKRISTLLRDGVEVLAHGRVSVYPPRGTYQLTVDQIEPLGAGALQLEFEQLKRKLEAEGLFALSRKRPLPPLVHHVAIVTSLGGAALHDFVHTLDLRSPWIRITVIPALVQGGQAASELISALERVSQVEGAQVVVLARGGGSMEDLWAFNDEGLARKIAACHLPVISAVGHEIDFTISDFVADHRAATPTAAAEFLSTPWVGLPNFVDDLAARGLRAMRRTLAEKSLHFVRLKERLLSPEERVRIQAQEVDELEGRLGFAIRRQLERKRLSLLSAVGKLEALSPLSVLTRGYSILREVEGSQAVVRSVAALRPGTCYQVRFPDGIGEVQTPDPLVVFPLD